MSSKRLRRFAIAGLVAAGCVSGSRAFPQVDLDLQESCSRQAETMFREGGYSKDITRPKGDESDDNDVIANFESHYNTVLGKCFTLLEIFGVGTRNAGFQIRSLFDADEGRILAEYAWGPMESKKSWEVRPHCRLMPSRNSQSDCHSEAEFSAFVAGYLEQSVHSSIAAPAPIR